MCSPPMNSDPQRTKASEISTQNLVPSTIFPRGDVGPSEHMATSLPGFMPSDVVAPLIHETRPQLPPLLPLPHNSFHQRQIGYPGIPNTSPTSTTSDSVAFAVPGRSLASSHSHPRATESRTQGRGSSGSQDIRDAIGGGPPSVGAAKQPLDCRLERNLQDRFDTNAQSLSQHSFLTQVETPIASSASLPMQAIPQASTAPSIKLPRDRFRLHIRQQPRAARAGPDGKDRRTIDPPPVLQLLINDFDLDKDAQYLKASDWVVHAKLVSAQNPHEEMNTLRQPGDGSSHDKVTRLLLGTTVSSPMFCKDDPDSANAPQHPKMKDSPPPSPTIVAMKLKSRKDPEAYKSYPGAYFIFADLSVRKAGQYRLEFTLMKMEPPTLQQGNMVPVISMTISDVFNVVNAKDFDQVQPSTNLVRGLLDRGAGFPLKLKKGLREGQRRRPRPDSDEEEEDEDEEDREDREDHEDPEQAEPEDGG